MTPMRPNAPALAAIITILITPGCLQTKLYDAAALFAPEPTRSLPVTAAMKAQPATVQPGEIFEVIVQVRIAGGYHIYSTNSAPDPFTPTTLNLLLPQPLTPAGEWTASSPPITRGGARVYTGCVSFRRRLKVGLNTAEQALSLKGELLCQACNAELCWPPARLELSAALSVSKERKK